MTRVAPVVPADTDLLCESCGYTLTGLPEGSNCPECGRAILSSVGFSRTPPDWELNPRPGGAVLAFLRTTAFVMFRPTRFYRTTTVRGDVPRAARFGHVHWILSSLLFGIAGSIHATLFYPSGLWTAKAFAHAGGAALLTLVAYLGLWATTWAAVRLTAWEAAYRGIRLPLPVVMRGMYYHASHYLPVAAAALLIIGGYGAASRFELVSPTTLTTYLYVLCGAVIAAAAYLFHTYWIGMRNMMYANR